MKLYIRIILQLIKFAILSCLFFPIFWTVSVIYDWFFSNSGFLLEIIHGPKDHYIRVLKQDWINSIPLSLFIALVIVIPIAKGVNHFIKITPASELISKSIIILATALWIYKTYIPGMIFFMASIVLLSLVYRLIHFFSQYLANTN
jgi:hypothetical protein